MNARVSHRRPKPIAEFDEHRFVHESLIEVCDLLGEALAAAADAGEGTDMTSHIQEINVLVWKMRWELGIVGGHAVSLADVESETADGT